MLTPESVATFERLAANHLWQSTGFAAVSVLLAFALKGNHARVRHWLWMMASVKFLIPFSVLIAFGGRLGQWLIPAAPVSRLPLMMGQIVQPFAPISNAALSVAPRSVAPMEASATHGLLPVLLVALWFCGFATVLLYGWVRWRRVAAAVRSSMPITEGRELEAFRRIEWNGSLGFRGGLPCLVCSKTNLEPGAFGFFRPVVCLPAGIANRLSDAELEAILTHELCHIRRRDNLIATLHMAVEAIFWFHPLVWWLGARLTEERERACDEEVVHMGGEPQVYAESILKVCEFYVASPIACAAGVTGGELKKRIEGIMMYRLASAMGLKKRLMLAAAAVAAVTGPLAFGIVGVRAQSAPQPSLRFDVVSVKILRGEPGGAGMEFPVNGIWQWRHAGIQGLVGWAYGVSWNRVEGVPKELSVPDLGFDIVAKMPLRTSRQDFRLMQQSLLADRFKAVIHTEVRDIPANTIEVAKGGVKLRPASGQCVEIEGNAPLPAEQRRCHEVAVRLQQFGGTLVWEYSGRSVSMADLASGLSQRTIVGFVVDDTRLSGLYDLDVKIETHPEQESLDSRINWERDWRGAWENQAGLLIDLAKTKKRPGQVIVVDHVELPTPN